MPDRWQRFKAFLWHRDAEGRWMIGYNYARSVVYSCALAVVFIAGGLASTTESPWGWALLSIGVLIIAVTVFGTVRNSKGKQA